MARKKEVPKPMFELRHDFIASLENVCQQAIMLLQVTDTMLQHSKLPDGIRQMLDERSKALRAALISEIPEFEKE